MDINNELSNSVLSGFINQNAYPSSSELSPQLLTNSLDEKVKTHIEQELRTCINFTFAVAFISNSVLTDLKVLFADLNKKNITGKILTSTYLAFNQPKVFQELLKIPNIEVRVLPQDTDFHAKGYIFEKNNHTTTIVGSSNLTGNALVKNYEWNIKFSSLEEADLTKQIKAQIKNQWNAAFPLTQSWINAYSKYYDSINLPKISNSTFKNTSVPDEIIPNKMQEAALISLAKLRKNGNTKGLIISATGTGKTYLGALDVRNYNPKKFLFIVHREQILKKALDSFFRVNGGDISDYGILSGNSKNTDVRYLFATVQSISQNNILKNFSKKEFDYILIDEVHRAGSKSYQKIIDYFSPDFLLGMTATPERTDDFNIYELFDYNIAYEIRLQEAIEENMLSEFHYIGITDYEYNGETIDDTTSLSKLVSEERMDYVEEQINYYGYSGKKIFGLIFCSRKEEAKEIATIMTKKGHPSVALIGDDSISKREKIITQFENGELEYIVTVDIFNEGIDIPKINQVIMLRNTQSSIIFIQQLGRGLRKAKNKDFVTIIDFIGNYQNNYLIPIALTGDKSLNKNSLRNKLATNQILGLSTINFSEIARERIYASINSNNLTTLVKLRAAYNTLKQKLGRIPLLQDFQMSDQTSPDPKIFIDKYESYHQFLIKMKDNQDLIILEDNFLKLISREFIGGLRIHELLLLQKLFINDGIYPANNFLANLQSINTYIDDPTLTSVLGHLDLSYYTDNDFKKYGGQSFVTLDNQNFTMNPELISQYNKNNYFKSLVDDVLTTGTLNTKNYNLKEKLTINKKYTRKNINSLIGWPKDQSSAMYGYREKDGICPIFITYTKRDDIKEELNYDNYFFNTSTVSWFTRSPRTLESNEVRKLLDGNKNGTVDLMIFLKKSDDEGSDFYYLGLADFDFDSIEQLTRVIRNKEQPLVKANLKLRTPVNYNLYLDIVE